MSLGSARFSITQAQSLFLAKGKEGLTKTGTTLVNVYVWGKFAYDFFGNLQFARDITHKVGEIYQIFVGRAPPF